MKFNELNILFTLLLIIKNTFQQSQMSVSQSTQQTPIEATNTIQCGVYQCVNNAGKCINFMMSNCTCLPEYDTFPVTSIIRCNYEKKMQKTAFLLELFLSYGSGHFYINNSKMAIPKFLFWFTGYYLFIILRVIYKQKEDEDPDKNTFATVSIILGFIFLILMVIWQIVDLVMFGLNKYTDGNGIDLLPWN